MMSGSENLIQDSSSDVYKEDRNTKEHFGKYFGKKLGIFSAIASVPGALALIAFHVMLLKPVIINYIHDVDYFRRFTDFEISGIGIVAGVVSLIFMILTIKTSLRPSFVKVVLTFLAQGICIALYLGVASFAIVSPIGALRWSKRNLLFCDCADNAGTLERNGTSPDSYDCKSSQYDSYQDHHQQKKMLPCSLVDERIDEITEKFLLCWIMVGIAIIQSCVSLIPFIMSIRTIWSVGDTFNKLTLACSKWGQHDENDTSSVTLDQICLNEGSVRALRVIARIQLVFGLISAIVAMSIDRYSTLIWQVLEFYAILSYVMVNWLTASGHHASYTRITGVAFVHLLVGVLALIPITLMSGIGFIMLLQMILYGIICTLLFGPLQKMAKLVTNAFATAVQKNANESS